MASEPCVALSVPSSIMVRIETAICSLTRLEWTRKTFMLLSLHKKRGKVEEVQRKVGVVLLNGQKLELSCDIKAVCKDVFDMVVAHIGLVEHHLFGLASLKGLSLTRAKDIFDEFLLLESWISSHIPFFAQIMSFSSLTSMPNCPK